MIFPEPLAVDFLRLHRFRLPASSRLSLTALFILSLASSSLLQADEAAVREELRAALAAKPKVWGEVHVGTIARTDPDPTALATARKIADAIRPKIQALPPVGLAPAVKAASVQADAVQRLKAQSGGDTQVLLRPGNGTVMQIRGGQLQPRAGGLAQAAGPGNAERTAREFLRANRELMRLDDPDAELKLESSERDETGAAHLKFSQWFRGVPVWPSGLSVHLDPQGNVESVDGAYAPTPVGTGINPALTIEAAVAQAKGGASNWKNGVSKESVLVIYAPLNKEPRLAWKFSFSTSFFDSWIFIVDATDGQILNRLSQTPDVHVVGSGQDLAAQQRNINLWSATGKYFMIDTTKQSFNPAFDPIQNPHGAISIFDARQATQAELKTVFLIESVAADNWLPEAVSALFNFGQTYDYFFERHGRNSIDGNGANVQAVVRVAQMANAFWSGDLKMMFFGDALPYAGALDVVGHELAHGVTQSSADLIYELQSGALNEAMSDIFGEMVEARAVGRADWQIGTDLGQIIRNLKNPGALQIGGLNRPYPSKMSEYLDLPNSSDGDHGGVHINSVIIGRAFYLLAEGLDGAIGLQDAAQIFYRCLTQRLQRQSQFIDARLGCIASAEALFGVGSTQARKTAEAFDVVEIFGAPPTPEPTPLPPVQGPDSTLLISFNPVFDGMALGRRETVFNDPIDGVALVNSVKQARPAVSGDGSIAVFADGASDVCFVRTDDPSTLVCAGVAGAVHSVAMSPDANFVAFVLRDPATGEADNKINVLNLAQDTTKTYELLAPVIDGSPVDTVRMADAMVFTPDGKQLIYDALSEIRFGGGTGVQRWSIFRINLPTDAVTVLVPPVAGLNFGNPNIGRTANRYLTFDAQEVATTNTFIVNMDLFTGDFGIVGTVGSGSGVPSFNGDDTAVVFAAPDTNNFTFTGYSLFRQGLTANRLEAQGEPTLWLADATVGVIYRRGTFVSSNALPSAQLTSPLNHGTYPAPASFTLAAKASDPDGTVAKVEFYEGGRKLGESAGPQYQVLWTNVAAGQYRLFARAVDNVGAIGDSTVIEVTVTGTNAPPMKLAAVRQGAGVVRLNLEAAAGGYIIQMSENLTNWTDIYPVTVGVSGVGTVEDASGGNMQRLFFRARKE
jgi:bacillolysin